MRNYNFECAVSRHDNATCYGRSELVSLENQIVKLGSKTTPAPYFPILPPYPSLGYPILQSFPSLGYPILQSFPSLGYPILQSGLLLITPILQPCPTLEVIGSQWEADKWAENSQDHSWRVWMNVTRYRCTPLVWRLRPVSDCGSLCHLFDSHRARAVVSLIGGRGMSG